MSTKKNRHPVHTQDRDGRAIVLVPLANHKHPAKLFAEDFDRLTEEGLGTSWTLNEAGEGYAYVRAAAYRACGKLVTVARMVLGAGRGRRVQYRDGDRLNLRRDNLYASQGYAKGKTSLKARAEGTGEVSTGGALQDTAVAC